MTHNFTLAQVAVFPADFEGRELFNINKQKWEHVCLCETLLRFPPSANNAASSEEDRCLTVGQRGRTDRSFHYLWQISCSSQLQRLNLIPAHQLAAAFLKTLFMAQLAEENVPSSGPVICSFWFCWARMISFSRDFTSTRLA